MRVSRGRILAGLILFAVTRSAEAEELRFRFIGNMAFEITDGETTLLTDFPYQSGAFGYMTYDSGELHPRKNAVCLITHRHLDHFDSSLLGKVGCTLVAPKEVTSKLPEADSLPLQDEIRFGPIRIEPVPTRHQNLEHYSYLVTWHGFRLYFAGDTGSLNELLETKKLDVLFVSPWVVEYVGGAKKKLSARKKVVYHHTPEERVKDCDDCLVPRQGETFILVR